MKRCIPVGRWSLCAGVFLLVLSACSEKPQTAGTPRKDQLAYEGTGVAAFTARGWTPGDKTSWASEQKARQMYGQNEYTRMTTAPVAAVAVKSSSN